MELTGLEANDAENAYKEMVEAIKAKYVVMRDKIGVLLENKELLM